MTSHPVLGQHAQTISLIPRARRRSACRWQRRLVPACVGLLPYSVLVQLCVTLYAPTPCVSQYCLVGQDCTDYHRASCSGTKTHGPPCQRRVDICIVLP